MNIYDVATLERELEIIAQNNEGEIPEEKFQELIEAQTKSVEQIDKLCQFIRHLETGIDACKAEENRISEMRKRAENRISSIKKYLTPFVHARGKITAGTFTLSTRKTETLELEKNFYHPIFSEKVEVIKNNKAEIKKAIKNGVEITGARIEEHNNLQIK